MAKIEAIENRLLNWARWRESRTGGRLGYASVNYERIESSRDRYREATIPCDDDEASKTELAVQSLGAPWTETVELVYVTGQNQGDIERRLHCAESTIKARVWEAHRRLSRWFTEREQLARDQRANLKALQQSARP